MRIGDGCGNDFDCDEISNSFCGIKEDDIMECECEPGYIPSTNKTSCLKLAHHIGDGCIEVEQCQIIPGTCIENTCVVLEGNFFINTHFDIPVDTLALLVIIFMTVVA